MRCYTVLSSLLIATACWSSPAIAAGLSIPAGPSMAVPIHDEAEFQWSGFYAGVFASANGGERFGLGVQAGINTQFDFFLVGAEVSVEGISGGSVAQSVAGQILGRAGLVVAEDAAVYAAAGYGLDLNAPADGKLMAGAGVELAVTDTVTVDARFLQSFPSDSSGVPSSQITLGARFHF